MKLSTKLLLLLHLAPAVHGADKTLTPKSGRCKGSKPGLIITLGKKNRDISVCVGKCLKDDSCVAIEYQEPKYCSLYYSKVKRIVDADGFFCGRVVVDEEEEEPAPPPPPPPTSVSCDDSPTYTFGSYISQDLTIFKDCSWISVNEKKKEIRQEVCTETINGSLVADQCPTACEVCPGSSPSKPCKDSTSFVFGTLEYEGAKIVQNCEWITLNPAKTENRRNKWCGRTVDGLKVGYECPIACNVCVPPTAKPSAVPSVSPTPQPTAQPTSAPTTSSPTITPSECTLKATLGWNFGDDPDDAAYYGYVAENLAVTMVNDPEDWECSWNWSDELPDWCTYSNSDPDGDSAYFANVEEYYRNYDEYESLSTETIVLIATAGRKYDFTVTRYFFEEDYYSNYDTWNDYMIAAVLKIRNESNPKQGMLKNRGWSRPTNSKVPSHILKKNGEWKVNPDFPDKINVRVMCDDECVCTSEYEVL